MLESTVSAAIFCRKLRGSSQAVLTRCTDDHYYVVKFTNNPNGASALRNEVVATRLAKLLSLPVPDYAFVDVDPWLLEHSPGISMSINGADISYNPGVHFGSLTPYGASVTQAIDCVPWEETYSLENIEALAGMLAFDLWTGRTTPRQALFKKRHQHCYEVMFVDHRANLEISEWERKIESPFSLDWKNNDGWVKHWLSCHLDRLEPPFLLGWKNQYGWIKNWFSFYPWLTLIEETPEKNIAEAFDHFPNEWGVSAHWKSQTIRNLLDRRANLRLLISQLVMADPTSFPHWDIELSVAVLRRSVLREKEKECLY